MIAKCGTKGAYCVKVLKHNKRTCIYEIQSYIQVLYLLN